MSNADETVNVNSLILKVREGDQQAFVKLLNKYQPLIESLVAQFESNDLTKSLEEDLIQEATLVFYNAILNYDENQSDVEFGLYARICMSNALVSQMRTIRRRSVEQSLPPQEEDIFDMGIVSSPVDDIVDRENLKNLYSVIQKNLSDYEYLIWSNYVKGKTAKEIGDLVGKSAKSVNNAIYRIRQKLRVLLK